MQGDGLLRFVALPRVEKLGLGLTQRKQRERERERESVTYPKPSAEPVMTWYHTPELSLYPHGTRNSPSYEVRQICDILVWSYYASLGKGTPEVFFLNPLPTGTSCPMRYLCELSLKNF